jgi:hypothetical protein
MSLLLELMFACGTERWTVKVMSDPAAMTVSLAPHHTTVAAIKGGVAPPCPSWPLAVAVNLAVLARAPARATRSRSPRSWSCEDSGLVPAVPPLVSPQSTGRRRCTRDRAACRHSYEGGTVHG